MSETFRVGVGALIANLDGQVLALERSDVRGAWQLPQGGVDDGEPLLAAAYREVEEELGIVQADLTLIDQHPVFLGYELPPELRSPKTGRGQCHRWFLFSMAAGARVQPPPGEVRAHRWMLLDELTATVAAFRRPVYEELTRYFWPRLRPDGEEAG
ncbi:MAG: NUDIX domain-containing protein [Gemmatimonadetes bacterium]|nr:NUDIX domain-containing protein [Gemmatimonadota bacterium]